MIFTLVLVGLILYYDYWFESAIMANCKSLYGFNWLNCLWIGDVVVGMVVCRPNPL